MQELMGIGMWLAIPLVVWAAFIFVIAWDGFCSFHYLDWWGGYPLFMAGGIPSVFAAAVTVITLLVGGGKLIFGEP